MRVSVVIVTFNRLYTLAELLESIARQTYRPHEIIIVNDGGEPADSLTAAYDDLPIRMINLEENTGHVHARNTGVFQAEGDAIMLCDDDDYFAPEHIERMVHELTDAHLVYSDVEIVEFEVQNNVRVPVSRRLFAYTYDAKEMRRFSTFVPSGSLYLKEVHQSIGYYDPDVHNYWDWDFFLRVSEKFQVKRVPVASVIYAFSDTGNHQSAALNETRQSYLEKLCEKHQLGELPQKNFFVLLEEPELKAREALSLLVWDGKPMIPRIT
ncbi:glycosyltransferase [Metabacillus idriensis]|uniref:Glycosyltransferase n=1 Tax=Metabacillus idriensis TaxID=324768 RepID=A0A6I2MEF6_9BACI|nr:glycosyltransferase family 2 protein [Metabacillus idriensis]MCM3597364.1 glycosyltransferase [Metabacillus idriensis]MRX54113.1 glycosyltransferase [Metabacillus idriensis]OHR73284.1 glycosyltransferase [Bacillus sp. HMSC76G11]